MNTCKTCRHWTLPSDDDHRASDLCHPIDTDTWLPMVRGFETRVCKQPTQAFAEAPTESNSFAMVDASEYYAVLVTGEDFGCVRHEEKTQ